MKIVLTTETAMAAVVLKQRVVAAIKGEIEGVDIETWSYNKSRDNFDVIYHNPSQYVNDPEKNVVFTISVVGTEVTFNSAWWKSKPEPSREMICLHTGRLAEMLLCYFSKGFIRFNIVDY